MDILNKILFLLFFLSTLNVVRHLYFIVQALGINKERYTLKDSSLWLLGLSIGFILTCIFTGITI